MNNARLAAAAATLGLALCLSGNHAAAGPKNHVSTEGRLACAGRAYISNSYSGGGTASVPGSVSVVDLNTDRVIATIPTGKGPINPTISPDGKYVYVPQADGGQIAVIDTSTNTVVRQLEMGKDARPSGLAFSRDGRRVVVSLLPGSESNGDGFIREIDPKTNKFGPLIKVGSHPERIALSPSGRRAYAVNIRGNSMSVVDLDRSRVVATIALRNTPFNLLVSPDGKKVYVGNARDTKISVISTRTSKVVGEIETPSGPNGMAYSPEHRFIYVTGFSSGKIAEISTATDTVVRLGDSGPLPGHIRLTPDGTRAYFVHPQGTSVAVLDTKTMKITGQFESGRNPTTLAICGGP